MTILQVKKFNRLARQRWQKAVSEWKPGKGGFPNLAFYIFTRSDTGEEYQKGWIYSCNNSHQYFPNRALAEKAFNQDIP